MHYDVTAPAVARAMHVSHVSASDTVVGVLDVLGRRTGKLRYAGSVVYMLLVTKQNVTVITVSMIFGNSTKSGCFELYRISVS